MTPLATILRAMREGRDDYTLQQQIDAMRAVIATGEQPRLRVRFAEADARFHALLPALSFATRLLTDVLDELATVDTTQQGEMTMAETTTTTNNPAPPAPAPAPSTTTTTTHVPAQPAVPASTTTSTR